MAKVLGKGLEALIQNYSKENKSNQTTIAISTIVVNQHQPRRKFDQDKMDMLINSIKEKGIIQPLTVRKIKNNTFELIAGERRYRAAKAIGIQTVPVFIIAVNNLAEMMELALIENIQRVDLNALEEAEGYLVLSEKYNFTQEEIAKNVSKSRSEVANKLRLLKLPDIIKKGLLNNKIYYAHARALLSISSNSIAKKIYHQIVKNKLNARQTEVLVKQIEKKNPNKQKKKIEFLKKEQDLQKILNTNIKIISNKNKQGEIKIKFNNSKDLERIVNRIKKC